jgi:hypothetical protein
VLKTTKYVLFVPCWVSEATCVLAV